MLKTSTKLYGHQLAGLDFLKRVGGGLLAWDCGTGKTLTALAFFEEIRQQYPDARMLVVCPLTLIESAWADDIEKFTSFKFCNLRKGFDPAADIYLVNYESYKIKMMNYANQLPSNTLCVLDESSKIKSYKAQITKKLLEDRDKYMWRVCMSATPAPNTELEYWAQAQFITPEVLPQNYFVYRNSFFQLRRGGQRVEGYMKSNIISDLIRKGFKYCLNPKKSEYFNNQLARITMRQRKEDCLDLPEQVDVARYVDMGVKQRKHYKEMKEHCVAIINDDAVAAQIKLVQIMKLRQITSGWLYGGDDKTITIEDGGAKMKELFSIIEENKLEKMIIWCTFKEDIKRIVREIGRVYGEDSVVTAYSESDTQDSIRRFKDEPGCRYIVANPRSIGHGVTLINCNIMVFFSMDYSYELYEQARGRTHRAGQRNPCTNIVLLAKDSIDEVVYDVVRKKMDKQDILTRLV